MSIYETVKVVNGYEITRMIGTKGFYHVRVDAHTEYDFRTIKAATAWILANLD